MIALPNGALSEIVTPGQTGFLVNSAEEMADAIREVDSLSPTACRHEAEARFSSERMFGEYMDLYRSLLASQNVALLAAA